MLKSLMRAGGCCGCSLSHLSSKVHKETGCVWKRGDLPSQNSDLSHLSKTNIQTKGLACKKYSNKGCFYSKNLQVMAITLGKPVRNRFEAPFPGDPFGAVNSFWGPHSPTWYDVVDLVGEMTPRPCLPVCETVRYYNLVGAWMHHQPTLWRSWEPCLGSLQ